MEKKLINMFKFSVLLVFSMVTNFVVAQMYISSNEKIVVDSASYIYFSRNIINNGTFKIKDQGMILQYQQNDNNSGTGKFIVERNSRVLKDDNRFVYWSSPVNGTTMDNVFGLNSYGGGTNVSDWYFWDESIVSGADLKGWITQSPSNILIQGKGYITTPRVDIRNERDIRKFEANRINNGVITLGISGLKDDYILVGNPYPSILDGYNFISDNPDLTGTLYFWHHNTIANAASGGLNNPDDYATCNIGGCVSPLTGGPTPDLNISTAQGFFVQVESSRLSNIVFSNSQRTVFGDNHMQFLVIETRNRFWLNFENIEYNYSSPILLGFDDNTTDKYDHAYDGKKFKSGSEINLYSKLGDGDFVIQFLERPQSMSDKIIPLGVDAYLPGVYKIELSKIDNWPDEYLIYLVDEKLKKEINLQEEKEYLFKVDEESVGTFEGRFFIKVYNGVTPDKIDSNKIDFSQFDNGEIYVYTDAGLLWVNLTNSKIKAKQVNLISMDGKILLDKNFRNVENKKSVGINNIATGVYIVRILLDNNTVVNKKIFLK